MEGLMNVVTPQDEGSVAAELRKMELNYKKQDIADRMQDRGQRKKYSYLIFAYICAYTIAVLTIVMLKGGGAFDLSDAVVITLLTTTMTSVIGLFVIVANYLFPSKKVKV